jgi:hypothetical protein
MRRAVVLSRHRLPPHYRAALALLWLLPIAVLLLALLGAHGPSPALLDPRLLPLLLMTLPALYIWREGVDLLQDGIVVRVHWPRHYTYDELDNWYYDARPEKHVLTVWDCDGRKALECRAVLTGWPLLLRALHDHLRYRNWPR